MTDDLKRQASELYKERTEEIRTSDSLSIKKLFYIALGLSLLAALVIQTFGGLKRHGSPAGTSSTPPPVAKDLPAPTSVQPMAPPSQPEPAKPVDQKLDIARQETKPLKGPNPSFAKKEIRKSASPGKPLPETARPAKQADTKPETAPGITPSEAARQELARDIVLGKSPALTTMIDHLNDNLDYRGWKAEAAGTDAYQVTFTFYDRSVGSPEQYVWRVDLNARSISPLSYYARKLP
jgi:hypothetical protein